MRFSYTALQSDGKVVKGTIDAGNENSALTFLSQRELRPISISEERRNIFQTSIHIGGNITTTDKIFLTKYLALMLRAGTDLFRALDILINDFDKPAVKRLLMEIRSSLEKGQPFYTTFARYPRQFEPVFVNLVKAGEISGNLEQTFQNVSVMLQKDEDVRRRIRAALTYPLVLLGASLLILGFLVTFALPRIADVFLQGGFDPPFFSLVVFTVSKFISNNLIVLGTVVILGGIGAWYFFFRTRPGRAFVFSVLRRTPVVRKVIERIAIQRFASTLGYLLKAGMPIIDSLDLTATAVGHPGFAASLTRIAHEGIARGLTLGEAFRKESSFPLVITTLVAVSEKAGHLDEVLFTLSTFYETEIDSVIKSLVSVLEPVMLVVLGGIVGLIALSVIVPIYQLIGQF